VRLGYSTSRDVWPYVKQVTVVGNPGDTALLGVSMAPTLGAPRPLPGLAGMLLLRDGIVVIPLGPLPPNGTHELVFGVRNVAPVAITLQAVASRRLTNALEIDFP